MAEAHRQLAQHVQSESRVFLDQGAERHPRKEKKGCLERGDRVGWKSPTGKDGHLSERLSRTEQVKDLLLPFGGDPKDFHATLGDHIKADPVVAFREDPFSLLERTPYADPGQRLVLGLRKTGEKGHAGKLSDHIHHPRLLSGQARVSSRSPAPD